PSRPHRGLPTFPVSRIEHHHVFVLYWLVGNARPIAGRSRYYTTAVAELLARAAIARHSIDAVLLIGIHDAIALAGIFCRWQEPCIEDQSLVHAGGKIPGTERPDAAVPRNIGELPAVPG